jgi:hypothetical protein
MELDKRDYTNFSDKKSFPGKIDCSTKEYHFSTLFNTDSHENIRKWEIKVRLIKRGSKKIKHGIDWNVLLDDTVPVKKEYLDGTPIPDGVISQVWVETGVINGKQTRHAPSYPTVKNEGKSNERNPFEQGLVNARTLYLKKLENGSQISKDFTELKVKQKNTKYFPMLVRKFADEKKNLVYPLYVQPKLDGARCIAYLDKSPKLNPTVKNIVMYTRQKKDYYGFDKIKKNLLNTLIDMYDFDKKESVYIDGELYKHGLDLQTISGAVRNPKRDEMKQYDGIQYWVFDLFYPSTDLTFKDRLEYLEEFFDATESHNIVQTPTHEVKSDAEQEKLYKSYLKKKYEGIILRNASSLYLTHPTKNSTSIRSKFVLKRKMTFDDEFEVVDFTQGSKGKDKGAIIWILKTHTTNKTFNSTPKNITYPERYKLYTDAKDNFNDKYKNRLMTVEYEDLSKDKIPLRAKSVGFRDHI